tara:strand:- start:70 stop:297 length:228 start_codon:yes stop_codon:yes gene_type:complete
MSVLSSSGFSFSEVYGEHGTGFIEVHHKVPVSTLGDDTRVDPKQDIAVVCSDCHRMIHRKKDDVPSMNRLGELLD